MKEKETITEENYKEKTLKRAIIVCWILLAICFVVKICGGNFFNIVCNNENFIKFCNYCDTSFVRYIIYIMYFMLESIVLILIIKPDIKIKSKRFLFYCLSVFMFWIVKNLYEEGIIKIDVLTATIVPLVVLYVILVSFSKKPIMSLLIILYQVVLGVISSFVKSISLTGTLSESMLFTFIFYIDYYIVFILTMLRSQVKYIKKEKLKYGIN